jgi:hypothetical protein
MQHDERTLHALQAAARLLGAVRLFYVEHDPNWLELALKVLPHGLSTGVLPNGEEVLLDYALGALIYRQANGVDRAFTLAGHTQKSLFQRLLGAMSIDTVSDAAGEAIIPAFYAALTAHGRRQSIKPEAVSDETPLQTDTTWAGEYAGVVYSVFTSMARFRARLNGAMTPLVVWPEHFDLSMLWFAAPGGDEHTTPHLNFGFSPPSPGINDFYLYSYAYPYPTQFDVPALPPGARWNEQPWRGVVVPYAAMTAQPDGEAFVEAACEGIFRALRPLLG